MEKVSVSIPGYRSYEYLLIVKPHEDLYNRIKAIKQEFAEKYKARGAAHTKPHIALVSFTGWGMMEEKMIQRLQVIAMGIAPFKIELSNFGSSPSHSIYINVSTKVPLQNLVKELKQAQRVLKTNSETKAHFIDETHITICRKLKPWQYEKGWLEYAHRHFTGRFIADSMLLLKRTAGEKKGYEIVKRFDFMNLPVATKQGDLFG
ncbi:MAG TPA: 2'-5' RNA ligase family protein [Chitinophagaceae bacterium]|nr:2'-5' RNA ligase family protein [Chitinophagaceae bacterium]